MAMIVARMVMALVIVARMIVAVMVMPVMRSVLQQDGGHRIDDQAQDGDRHRLLVGNRGWIKETVDRFPGDEQGDDGEDHGRGIGTEIAELAGSEGKVVVFGLLFGKDISCQ